MDSYTKQVRFVLGLEILILVVLSSVAYLFWSLMCPAGWDSCLGSSENAPLWFIVYATIRPLVATPSFVLALIGGSAFGPFWGAIFAAFGATLSCLILYVPAKYIGKIYIKPFLSTNLPAMWRLIRTQDYKVVFMLRWIPLFPFDLFSVVFGVADLRMKSVALATFFGMLPESFMFAHLASRDPSASLLAQTTASLTLYGVLALVPLLVYELIVRSRGQSLFKQIRGVYRELLFELKTNNEILRRYEYDPTKTPVILVYGFFSSRRSMNVLERILQAGGFQVMSFNLGGFFGVFFTKGISDTARFIDLKIRRQLERYDFKKVQIVAHSKGGLVAVYWLLKLSGYKICDTVITMGTPFKGSSYTYLALVTPLGLFWRDVWQMRPGSEFLKELSELELPENVRIYCLHSIRDGVAGGPGGIYQNTHNRDQIVPVPMNHLGHFEFLYRRDVGAVLTKLLKPDAPAALPENDKPRAQTI